MGRRVLRPRQFMEPVFVSVMGEGFAKVGQLKDLSIGGLLYEYMEEEGAPHPESVNVDIFSRRYSLFLEQIPCTLQHTMVKEPVPYSTIAVRRCILKFDGLTPEQQRSLWVFLGNRSLQAMSDGPSGAPKAFDEPRGENYGIAAGCCPTTR